jgi:hypothetical protein
MYVYTYIDIYKFIGNAALRGGAGTGRGAGVPNVGRQGSSFVGGGGAVTEGVDRLVAGAHSSSEKSCR